MVFDEVYYTTMATQYLAGTPFYDRHPPTARLIFAMLAKLAGADPASRFESTTIPYGDFPYHVLRMGSATAGVLVVVFITLIGKDATGMPLVGLIAGILTVFDNALTLFSRYILGDIFILCFGLGGLWCYIRKNHVPYTSKAWYAWLALSSILCGLSLGVKMTGGVFLAMAWWMWYREKHNQRPPAPIARLFLLILPAVIVIALMTIHFLLLDAHGPVLNAIGHTEPTTIVFFDELRNSTFIHQLGEFRGLIMQRVIEIIIGTLVTVAGHLESQSSILASPAWIWPLMVSPIPLMILQEGQTFQVIHLLGNPAIWWGGLIALVYVLSRRFRYNEYKTVDPFLFGYVLNIAVLSFSRRGLVPHLYLPSLVFLILITATVLANIYQRRPKTTTALIAFSVLMFLFFMPLTYGLPRTQTQIQRRIWLPAWNPLTEEYARRFHISTGQTMQE